MSDAQVSRTEVTRTIIAKILAQFFKNKILIPAIGQANTRKSEKNNRSKKSGGRWLDHNIATIPTENHAILRKNQIDAARTPPGIPFFRGRADCS